MIEALSRHWVEYLCEAGLLGTFMVVACAVVSVVEHPSSPVRRAIERRLLRRAITGLCMGLTAIVLVTSAAGRRSGGHLNPSFTLAQYALGKVAGADAAWYIIAQFCGAIAGVAFARVVLRTTVSHESVTFAATRPGRFGLFAAWAGEFVIAFTLFSVVLRVSNDPGLAALTPLFAGALVAAFITLEAPISGMSMNPARSLGSAVWARAWHGQWIYFTAPPIAMLLAGVVFVKAFHGHVYCCKMDHRGDGPCIFHCEIEALRAQARNSLGPAASHGHPAAGGPEAPPAGH